jgi:hypothetical protein
VIGIQEIDAREFRKVLSVLKKIEPDTQKELARELKSNLIGVAQQVASAVPVQAPLSGLDNNGRTAWSRTTGKVSFTPGKSRTNAKSLVSIRADFGNKSAGVAIAELAGSRSTGFDNRGRSLIEQLNTRKQMKGKGGRYAYAQFRLLRPDIVRIATEIINKSFKKFEGMLD